MSLQEIIPTCPACSTPMVLKTKGNDRFWGCPNYKSCGGKTIQYKGEPPKDKPAVIRSEQPTDIQIIMDLLTTIDKGQREIWKLLTKIYDNQNK